MFIIVLSSLLGQDQNVFLIDVIYQWRFCLVLHAPVNKRSSDIYHRKLIEDNIKISHLTSRLRFIDFYISKIFSATELITIIQLNTYLTTPSDEIFSEFHHYWTMFRHGIRRHTILYQ